MATKANIVIDITDIDNLELPDGYELKKVKTKAEKIKELEDEITELEAIPEPTDEEYLQWGKATHDFTMTGHEIASKKEQLKELKK